LEIFHEELVDPLVDLGRFARSLARLQRLSLLGLGGVTLGRWDADPEGASGLGLGHASLYGVYDLPTEVIGIGFHPSMMSCRPFSSQHAVSYRRIDRRRIQRKLKGIKNAKKGTVKV
jgi:hypothetical protein